MIDYPDGSKAVVDQTTLDYLASTAPDPTQSSLAAALSGASMVRIYADGACQGRPMGDEILYESDDAQEIAGLAAVLAIIEDPETFGHCMCDGGPTLVFSGAQEVVISLHHGRSIRWDAWRNDAMLVVGDRLVDWLADRPAAPLVRERPWSLERLPILRGAPSDTGRKG